LKDELRKAPAMVSTGGVIATAIDRRPSVSSLLGEHSPANGDAPSSADEQDEPSTKTGFLLKKSEGKMLIGKSWHKRKCVVADGLMRIYHEDETKAPTDLQLALAKIEVRSGVCFLFCGRAQSCFSTTMKTEDAFSSFAVSGRVRRVCDEERCGFRQSKISLSSRRSLSSIAVGFIFIRCLYM